MVKVLGIDCAGSSCSAAILVDLRCVAARFEAMGRGQAEALLPMIADVLDAAKLDVTELDRIAVTVGPGSFTGLRTGLATARGLALARGLPIVGVTSFEAAADAVTASSTNLPLVVALESKRQELFLQLFQAGVAQEAALVPPSAWVAFAPCGRFRLTGDGAKRFAASVIGVDGDTVEEPTHSAAVSAARLAITTWKPDAPFPPPRPFYLRAPDVSFPASRAKSVT